MDKVLRMRPASSGEEGLPTSSRQRRYPNLFAIEARPAQPPAVEERPRIEELEDEDIQHNYAEREGVRQIVMDAEDVEADDYGNPISPVYAALLQACRECGYDASHEKRKELVNLLEKVHEENQPFPQDVMQVVTEKTGLSEAQASPMLKPQVHRVLDGMRNAVKAEEERLAELRRLEEEQRRAEAEAERRRIAEEIKRKEEEHRRMAEKLQTCGLCPMGYTWHRCRAGWRCAGGSHYVPEGRLPSL